MTDRRGAALPVAVAVVGLGLIGVAQWGPTRLAMEDDLTSRSIQALRDDGLNDVEVAFTGQDAVLTGHVDTPDDAQRAVRAVSDQEGVRVVRSELGRPAGPGPTPTASPTATESPTESASPTTAAPAAPSGEVKLSITKDVVAITGRVPDQATRDALLAAARATYAETVVDRMTVDPSVGRGGLDGIGPVLQALGRDGRRAAIVLSGGQLTLAGFVADDEARVRVEGAARDALGDTITVVNRMEVGP